MPMEPTQTLQFEIDDDLEDTYSEVNNPAGYLIEVSKHNTVKETHIIGRASTKYEIGRAYTCDIIIDQPSISNKHASLEVDNGVLWITDEESTNHTTIGDNITTATTICQSGRGYQVISKQFVTLGDVHFQFYNYVDYCAFIRDGGCMTQTVLNPDRASVQLKSLDAASAPAVSHNLISGHDIVTVLEKEEANRDEAGKKDCEGFDIPQIRSGEEFQNVVLSNNNAAGAENFDADSGLPETQTFDPLWEGRTDECSTQVFDPCWHESPSKNEPQWVVEAQSPGQATQAFEISPSRVDREINFSSPLKEIPMNSLEGQSSDTKYGVVTKVLNTDSNELQKDSEEQERDKLSPFEATQAFDGDFQELDKEKYDEVDDEFGGIATQAFDPGFLEDEKKEVKESSDPYGSATQTFDFDFLEMAKKDGNEKEEKSNEGFNVLEEKVPICNEPDDHLASTSSVKSSKEIFSEEANQKARNQNLVEQKENQLQARPQEESAIVIPQDEIMNSKQKVNLDACDNKVMLSEHTGKLLETKKITQNESEIKMGSDVIKLSKHAINNMEKETAIIKINLDIDNKSSQVQSSVSHVHKNSSLSDMNQKSEFPRDLDQLLIDVLESAPKKHAGIIHLNQLNEEATVKIHSNKSEVLLSEDKERMLKEAAMDEDSKKLIIYEPSAVKVVCTDNKEQQEKLRSMGPCPTVVVADPVALTDKQQDILREENVAEAVKDFEVSLDQRSTSSVGKCILSADDCANHEKTENPTDSKFRPSKSQPDWRHTSNKREITVGPAPVVEPRMEHDEYDLTSKLTKKSFNKSGAAEFDTLSGLISLRENHDVHETYKKKITRPIEKNRIVEATFQDKTSKVLQETQHEVHKGNTENQKIEIAPADSNALKVQKIQKLLSKSNMELKVSEAELEEADFKKSDMNGIEVKEDESTKTKIKTKVEKTTIKTKPKKRYQTKNVYKRTKSRRIMKKKRARKAVSVAIRSVRSRKSTSKNLKKITKKRNVNSKKKVPQENRGKKRKLSVLSSSKSKSNEKKRRASVTLGGDRQKPCVLRTGVIDAAQEKSLTQIGATILSTVNQKVTHLCMDKFRTTEKVLCGLAYCNYLVSSKWLTKCLARRSFTLDEEKFPIPMDAALRRAEKDLGFKLSEVISRRNRKRKKLFHGLKLFMTKKVPLAFGRMFTAHGGTQVKIPGRKYHPDVIVLGLEDSDEEAQQLVKKRFRVRNTSWIKASIFRQKLPKVSEFRVKQKNELTRSLHDDSFKLSRRRSISGRPRTRLSG